MFCPKCGREMKNGEKFCARCGTLMGGKNNQPSQNMRYRNQAGGNSGQPSQNTRYGNQMGGYNNHPPQNMGYGNQMGGNMRQTPPNMHGTQNSIQGKFQSYIGSSRNNIVLIVGILLVLVIVGIAGRQIFYTMNPEKKLIGRWGAVENENGESYDEVGVVEFSENGDVTLEVSNMSYTMSYSVSDDTITMYDDRLGSFQFSFELKGKNLRLWEIDDYGQIDELELKKID